MKTHYEVLGLDPSADTETIKKAFRREIARYHPDKVIHLGQEFQEMAATRAAELTVAYKTLSDEAQRSEYDASLADGRPTPPMPVPAPAAAPAPPAAPVAVAPAAEHNTPPPPQPNRRQFESERAGRDEILRRAMSVRVQGIIEDLYGKVDTPKARGFDLVLVPVKGPRLLGATPPRVLVKVVDKADAASVNEAWSNAIRARVHVGKSPLVVLLFSKHIAPQGELLRAVEALNRQPKAADGPSEISVVIVDTSDWSARLPPGASAVVRKIADRLRN